MRGVVQEKVAAEKARREAEEKVCHMNAARMRTVWMTAVMVELGEIYQRTLRLRQETLRDCEDMWRRDLHMAPFMLQRRKG